jgi:RNA polymerase sigma factor (sigma-70 family)
MVATTASGIEAARALDELYREHAAEIFRYAYAVLGNRADAEDVTQTTFVNALRALERGERPHTPKNWLITIAHNLIRQRFRQQQARPREVELDQELPAAEADESGPSLDDLVRSLQRIPATQRQALVLRELEGRSYEEMGRLLEISQSALETLIFRARRSLAEELENLVTCDGAELALSRETDGRLGRKERRRLLAHLDECTNCARIAARSMKHRRAFKLLAVLPLPFSLTLFNCPPTASAAAGLPTIGAGAGATAGAAAGVGAAGVSAKFAVGLAAVALAGGAGYEGVQAVGDRLPAPAATKADPAKAAPGTPPVGVRVVPVAVPAKPVRRAAKAKSAPAKPIRRAAKAKSAPAKPARAASPSRGGSATAPGHEKRSADVVKVMPPTSRVSTARPQTKAARVAPAATPPRGKSSVAPGRLRAKRPAKTAPAKPKAEKTRTAKPQTTPPAAKAEKAEKAKTPVTAEKPEKPAKSAAATSRGGGGGAAPTDAEPAP